MPLSAGRLRHRIQIQQPVYTQDLNSGAVSTSWQVLATVWAEISPLSARDMIAANTELSRVTDRIVLRYRTDVTNKMRFYHPSKDVYYNLEGDLPDPDSGLEYVTYPVSRGLKYQEGDPEDVLPVNLEAPETIGTATVGVNLTSNNGIWANDPDSYLYQWFLDATPIVGQTNANITVPNNIGQSLQLGVKGVNGAGQSAYAMSAAKIIA